MTNLTKREIWRTIEGMEAILVAHSNPPQEANQTREPEPLRKFGQNVLGITIHSDDWEKDIPLKYFQDVGKENPFGN